ncbi:MAG: zinc-finger domain-containing protein [Pseudomarimonas sp.]
MSTSTPARSQPAPIHVAKADLPLSCPMPGAAVWNMHPKVYLPIEATGRASCPYCGASYVLQP